MQLSLLNLMRDRTQRCHRSRKERWCPFGGISMSIVHAGFLGFFILVSQPARAHGGVTLEDDQCIIRIDYLRAHFKVFQPLTAGHEEFCEDLPEATESVFVMEYLHDALTSMSIDFRIIRDVTGKGRFARIADVEQIADIDAVTLFHKPASVDPDVYTAVLSFEEEGDYIGIVTLWSPESTETRTAVFPFAVGFRGYGYWPVIGGIVILLQIQYFLLSGRFRRWRKPKKPRLTVVAGGRDSE